MTRLPAGPHVRLAACLWLVAAAVYLGVEALAASVFVPSYSYARNYISDLGVPTCGIVFDGRPICSPLHGLMNANFIAQGLLFFAAALGAARAVTTTTKFVFVAFAALDCAGNVLVGTVPETARLAQTPNLHVVGAILAIGFGNATALASAWTFRELRLPRVHARVSMTLPLVAGAAMAALVTAGLAGHAFLLPDGVWERTAVYTITAWQVVSGVCVLDRKGSSRVKPA